MNFFVREDSVVRRIWGKADTILFIFAGASAEFALNKAVDWLYYTGKIPSDPLGRLFSTVDYARMIVFSPEEQALQAIDRMNAIHGSIESSRGDKIPDWAYRDVLFMLIDYSIRAFEVLERPLTRPEKEETFDVFYRVGARMAIRGSTVDLYKQYRKHLGPVRFLLLLQAQSLVTPRIVGQYLSLSRGTLISLILPVYKLSRRFGMDRLIKKLILPPAYQQQINNLDRV